MQMQSNIHPQQMEWLMHQQHQLHMQGSQQAMAPRAYRLEPLNAKQQFANAQGMMIGQQCRGGMMGGMSAYGPGSMVGDVQDGHSGSFGAGVGSGAAYSAHGPQGMYSLAYGAAGMGGPNNTQKGQGAPIFAGTARNGSDRGNINFHEVFDTAANPLTQLSVATQDDGKPLPFPPGKILAQYPTEYQQQLVFYYRLLRLQYPELYQQYVDYYVKYYEPLYYPPAPSSPIKEDFPDKQVKKPPPPPLQPKAPRAETPRLQPIVSQHPITLRSPAQSSPEQPAPPESIPRTVSNLSGGLKRQSSLRRQNSIRRSEVHQLKNEGGLRRLSSMRKQ
ncbi:hypothetical protein JKF63_02325 [Porcisia hertigi]|uniref:Uncharacterized protein n=1 Tax=Porcisia hertigi TaxID=2761500 RepID=A0A836HM23_9TRYP|nr:hypothetical protein JKF63_02325 [Porcisia hertigi]